MASRKGTLPRVSSLKGVLKRQEIRVNRHEATVQALRKANDKTFRGFTKPGSRNPRKIGR
jgi:hypothetical protein